jgi:hypothetical protein
LAGTKTGALNRSATLPCTISLFSNSTNRRF